MFLLLLLAAIPAFAETWSLDKLFTRPYVWGTSPSDLKWSKQGHTLAFLWNAEGNRFLDLYAYHPEAKKLVRLTDLESFTDDLLLSADEKDARKKLYLEPPAGLSSFALSHDGTQAAFSYKGELFTVPTSGANPPFRLTRTTAFEAAPQFSPGGTKLASVRSGQIVVQDLSNGQLWQVTNVEAPSALSSYQWSPDGKWFSYTTRKGQRRQITLANYSGQFVTTSGYSRDVAGEEPVDSAAFVIASEGGKSLALQASAFGAKTYSTSPDWSPDSASLLMRHTHPAMKKQEIVVLDARTGKSKAIVEETDPAWVYWSEAGWSPDSKFVWFVSERDGFAHLYKVAAAGGKPEQLTKGAFEVRPERFTHDPQWIGDWLYFSSTEIAPSERHFYRIHPDGGGKEKLSTREGINDGLRSEDGLHTAWMLADLKNPLDLWVDGERVTRSPRAEFAQVSWTDTRFVTFPSRKDRQRVHAKLLLPPGYDSARKYPCVFFIHGAGYATSVLKQWGSYQENRFAYNTYLANQGYVVMDLDYRGSSGYGRDWRTGVYLQMGGPDLQDVLGAVDYLGTLGSVDMSRLGVWGVSYGGFMTNMAMFVSPDTFKAGSSWAAVNDWENYNAYYTTQRLNSPAQSPEAYRRSSPILFSSGLKNHLLMLHGMVDNNVLFQDAVQLTEKLIQEGKDFAHFYYPQENHAFIRDETWIDACRRTTEWFSRFLK